MRVLLTGASSFTGAWFVRALVGAGHEVLATFRSPLDSYEGVRARRAAAVAELARTEEGVAFGDGRFLALLGGGFDVVCHHGAEVGDYRSADFDVEAAVRANTHGLAAVVEALAPTGAALVLTGTVFESGEGRGDEPLRAFSPYGESKSRTSGLVAERCEAAGVPFGKFVVPNPFGPWEEPRFTSFLARSWLAGERPSVRTPDYVRDNIQVSLLGLAYARFAAETVSGGSRKLSPSGYVESQGAFAHRLSRELAPRLGVECPVDLAEQTEFPEPRVRVNTDSLDAAALGWDEAEAWDELAAYYLDAFGRRETA